MDALFKRAKDGRDADNALDREGLGNVHEHPVPLRIRTGDEPVRECLMRSLP